MNRTEYINKLAWEIAVELKSHVIDDGDHVRGVAVPERDVTIYVEAYENKIHAAKHQDRLRVHLQPVHDPIAPIPAAVGSRLQSLAPEGVTFRNDPRPRRKTHATSALTWGPQHVPESYEPELRTARACVQLLLTALRADALEQDGRP